MDEKDAFLMLSNSDPKNKDISDQFFDNLYKNYNINRISAKRYINSNASKRGEINELIITNYII
jgi:DNA adenine methylase